MANHTSRADGRTDGPTSQTAAPTTAAQPAEPLRQSQWERLAFLIGDRKSSVIVLAICSTVAAVCESGILAISARAATALVNRSAALHGHFGPVSLDMSVRELLFIGLGLAVLRLLLQGPISYLPSLISGDVQASMRRRLVDAHSRASWDLQSQGREGHFQEMMTNQIQQASQGASQATQLIIALATFLILVLSAFALNPIAALAVFGAAILLFAALRPANAIAMRLARRLSAAQLDYAGSVGEANRVTEEVNVFGVADEQCSRINRYILAARALFVKAQVVQRLVPNLYQSLIYFVLVLGLLAISEANLAGFSSLGAVVLLLVRAGTYGQNAQGFWVSMRQSLPYVERLQNAIDAYTQSARSRGSVPLGAIATLQFEGVDYYYRSDRPVLRDLTFSVAGGETIGVIGPSGAGKSTMVQILLRLREPRTGRFLINDTDATDIRFSDWHARVAYVPQAPKLIHASVADNVRFYRDYDDAAVERACRLARIHDEIMAWPNGYETIVGPRADAVSGGQQQRICLARALISQPSMLVLDEPTSALDPRSEALIQESLQALHSELTLFIIAHRMSTLSICNRVMVVLDGHLDAFDTLPALTAGNDYYRMASGLSSAEHEPEEPDPEALIGAGAWVGNGDGPAGDGSATLDGEVNGNGHLNGNGHPHANGHSGGDGHRNGHAAIGSPRLVATIRRSADEIARATSIDALIGRPTVLEKQARLLLRGLPALPQAVAAVQSRLDPAAPTPEDEPLFVFSAGWRSGSTLVQRLVVSAGTHMVWGEPYHSCDLVRRLAESLLPFGDGWPPPEYLYDAVMAAAGGDLSAEWIANLYPPVPTLVQAHREALRTFLAPPPDQPETGWGMKEVRLSGEHALYLRMLFPRARFVFLVRNPADAYASYRSRPRWFDRWPREQIRTPHAYGRMWSRLAESFLVHGETVGAAIVRYEDLAAGGPAVQRLEHVLGAQVDRSVFGERVGSSHESEEDLPLVEARILARATRVVATRFGYAVDAG